MLAGICDASPTGTARMTVSKMRMADLETSASGYAYDQRAGLPVSYVRYTNHGSGRYYHAPTPVHYVVGSSAPVASAVSETASPHESALLATRRHEIAPYALRQMSARDGHINYGADQLTKYARPLELAALAPYYTPNAFASRETKKNVDKRNDKEDGDSEDIYENNDDDADNIEEDKDNVTENRKKAHFMAPQPAHALADTGRNVEVTSGLGEKYLTAQNSAHGEKGDKGYKKQVEFDVGEQKQYDKGGQKESYDVESEKKKGHSGVAGNYGRYDETTRGEKGSSYGETSYHKKGEKTRGFHKVYHKDEYKKQTDFYDESHKKGYFDKHASADEHHTAAEGNFKNGENHESGFDYKNIGKKGFRDKGHADSHDQAYNKEKGEDSFHKNYENYDSREDALSTKKHGYEKVN
ncbi:stress protein DDR48-like [Pseudomyrmex gracilis]|uniref:stress protein DDR48-like n=1 Tax=Pseudomyrmex gracilis TaxID=219809 RepID=UPI0009959660|nr:stress protein DDR48-like [Pseudomyrmex gracilis]